MAKPKMTLAVTFDPEDVQAIHDWRRRQDFVPTTSAAMRRLIKLGLEYDDQNRRKDKKYVR